MSADLTVTFTAPLWRWTARTDLWTFVSVPQDLSDEIGDMAEGRSGGFGSVPVRARVGTTTWRTSLFPLDEAQAYVLPIKRAVRDRQDLTLGADVTVTLDVFPDD